jgi:hypothetical protein
MKLFNVYSADGDFIGSWVALGPEDAITKAKEAIQRSVLRYNWLSIWREPFVAKLFR